MHMMYVKAVKMYVVICLYLKALFSSEERKVSVPMATCTVQETATYSLHLQKMMEKGNWDRREWGRNCEERDEGGTVRRGMREGL